MTHAKTILALCLLALPVFAGQRAAQVFDGVKMAAPLAIALPTTSELLTEEKLVASEPVNLLTAPAPHEVTLEWYQDGNVLRHGIEEAPSPLGPWELVAVRWNDYIYANTTFRVTFVSQRNPAFWRVAASNKP